MGRDSGSREGRLPATIIFTYVELYTDPLSSIKAQFDPPAPCRLPSQRKHLAQELAHLRKTASSSFLYPLAHRQRLAALDEGYVSKAGWMEKLVWAPARARRSLDKLRAVVVVGGQSFVLSHGSWTATRSLATPSGTDENRHS
jgi:hypothetical protein